ncbi:hypothetical protein [Acinetobacter wuhouensis]|uniref:hypothetical protein n=1 Tax=Acinetobacter wuhouensis TaxID=1879050 RepID=UPI001BC86D2E|nr:hypothetical protein [Acinetobacter wuhouensis]
MAIETTYFGLNNSDLAFWSMIGTWLASIATVAAVILSLYISINTNKLKLKILNNITHFGDISSINFDDVYFGIEVINVCDRTITVESIYLLLPNKSSLVFPYYDSPYSTRLPKKIEHSEKTQFYISYLKNEKGIKDYLLILKDGDLDFKKWRFAVRISTGQVFTSKINPRIISKLEELKEAP